MTAPKINLEYYNKRIKRLFHETVSSVLMCFNWPCINLIGLMLPSSSDNTCANACLSYCSPK